jgi:hypothetical protein
MKAKEVIKRIFVQLNVLSTINRLRYYKKQRVYYNVNNAKYKKRCLLIYIVDPFIEKAFPERHQNLWQAKEMVFSSRFLFLFRRFYFLIAFFCDQPVICLVHL